MTTLKPLAFVRKQLKTKGKSVHSGRGFYECYSDKTNAELFQAAQQCLQSWQDKGYIASIDENTSTHLCVTLHKDKFEGVYRHMIFFSTKTSFNRQDGMFLCSMC